MGEVSSCKDLILHTPQITPALQYLYINTVAKYRQELRKLQRDTDAYDKVLDKYLQLNIDLVTKHNSLVNTLLVTQQGVQDSDFGMPSRYMLEGNVMEAYAKYKLCKRLFKTLAQTLHPDRGGDAAMFQAANNFMQNMNVEGLQDMYVSCYKAHDILWRQTHGVELYKGYTDALYAQRSKLQSSLACICAKLHFKQGVKFTDNYVKTYLQERITQIHLYNLRS